MQYSFSFCGTDVKEIGLGYAPDNADTYVFATDDFSVSEQEHEAHNGGHFFGTTVKPKSFTLRCYYENKDVCNGLMSKVYTMFKRGRTGKLVFSQRPWQYYIATVTNVDASRLLNLKNGLLTIQMKAYYPFALTDYNQIPDNFYRTDMEANTAMFVNNIYPAVEFTNLTQTPSRPILLYNGGTERASVNICIAGNVGEGVSIYNRTTDQECDIVGLNEGSASHYLVCNGRTGNVYWSDTQNNGFIHHHAGFIELEPAYPVDRNLSVRVSSRGTTVTAVYGSFNEGMIGKYIYLSGDWYKIVNVTSENELTINLNIDPVSITTAPIATMNEIIVTPESTMNLSLLRFDYKHTFA